MSISINICNYLQGGEKLAMFKSLDLVALALVIVGGLNWGLVGAFNFNLVSAIFGTSIIARIVYIVVGLAAAYMIYFAATKK